MVFGLATRPDGLDSDELAQQVTFVPGASDSLDSGWRVSCPRCGGTAPCAHLAEDKGHVCGRACCA